jgi:hypothetical protein
MKITCSYVLGACALAVSFSLAGCGSSEPSETEMFDAMIAYDQNHMFFGRPEKFKTDAKKLGCEKAGEKSYKCLVGKRDGKGGAMPAKFMKTDGRWVMTGFGASAG